MLVYYLTNVNVAITVRALLAGGHMGSKIRGKRVAEGSVVKNVQKCPKK